MTAAGDRLETGRERSSKVTAAAAAAAIATVVWTIVAVAWPDTFNSVTVATLTGATATVLTFLLAWQAPENERYLRWATEWRNAKQVRANPAGATDADTARLAAGLEELKESMGKKADPDVLALKNNMAGLGAQFDQLAAENRTLQRNAESNPAGVPAGESDVPDAVAAQKADGRECGDAGRKLTDAIASSSSFPAPGAIRHHWGTDRRSIGTVQGTKWGHKISGAR